MTDRHDTFATNLSTTLVLFLLAGILDLELESFPLYENCRIFFS